MTIVKAYKPGGTSNQYMFLTRELAEQWAEFQVVRGYVVEIEGS